MQCEPVDTETLCHPPRSRHIHGSNPPRCQESVAVALEHFARIDLLRVASAIVIVTFVIMIMKALHALRPAPPGRPRPGTTATDSPASATLGTVSRSPVANPGFDHLGHGQPQLLLADSLRRSQFAAIGVSHASRIGYTGQRHPRRLPGGAGPRSPSSPGLSLMPRCWATCAIGAGRSPGPAGPRPLGNSDRTPCASLPSPSSLN